MEKNNKTILIVEDDFGLQDLIAEIVSDCGFKPVCIGTAHEAISWLKQNSPYLMILDYRLPDMNGKEVISGIADAGILQPPFIVSTGNGDERIAVDMMKLRARDYIIKDANYLEILPYVIGRVSRDLENEESWHRAECDLNELNLYNRQIIESAREGIIVYQADLRYKVWNPFMEELTGVMASDVIGNYPLDVFPFLAHTGLIENLNNVLQGGSGREIDFEFRIEATGRRAWVSDNIAPLYNSSGEIMGIIGTVRDITSRKLAEISLRVAEEQQRAMIENISDVIAIIDSQGIIRYKSANIENWFGWNPDELIGKNGFENIHPLDRDYAIEKFGNLLNRVDATADLELRYKCSDGSYKWIKLTATNKTHNKAINGVLVNYHDITERKQMRESLVEKEELLRFYVENAPMAIIEFDAAFRITRWTGFSQKIFGWSANEAIGKTIAELEIIYEEDQSVAKATMDELINGTSPQVIASYRNLRKDGRVIHCEWYNTVLKDANGRMLSIMSQVLDISERKHAEQVLVESEEKYRNLFENMNEAFGLHQIILDEEGNAADFRYLEVNPEFAKRLGMPQEDIVNRTALELFPQTEKVWIEKFGEVALTGTSMRFSSFSDATNRYYETFLFSPRKGYFAGLFTDITERIQQENEIRKLSKAIDSLQSSIVITNTSGKIVFANPYFSEITGYSKEEFLGETPRILKSGFYNQEFYQEMWNTILSGKTWEGEMFNKKKNGEYYWEYSVISPIHDKSGEIVNFVAVKTNITEIKKINEALVQAKEKAEESDRLKTAFLQNISHELRTPMNAIVGFSELIAENVKENRKMTEYSSIIKLRCNDLLNIVNDILDIAKIEAGQISVNIELCNLELLFRDLNLYYSEHKKRIRKDHLQFTIHPLEGSSGPFILTDCLKLKQIFVNLLDNAFKFTHSGKIEAGCVSEKKGNYLFYVSDSGIGISYEKQSVIFERFAQLNIDSGQVYGGTGLGLSIVKGLVKAMNGKIWLESEPNKGTTFYFTIPAKVSDMPVHTLDDSWINDSSENQFINKSVLIVEDDLYNGEFLVEALSETGLKMKLAGYGKEAVELACSSHFDVILMDINLPDMTGYEAVKQILEVRPYQKIIAQTAYAASEDEQKSINAGCVAYLSKPISRKMLFNVLNKLLVSP